MSCHVRSIVVACLVLCGCDTLKHPVPIDWLHGAKRGTLTRVFDPATPPEQLPPCLAALPLQERATHRYVEIEHLHRRHLFRDVAELPPGVDAGPGDGVEFYPKDCDAGALSVIARRLPAAP